MIHHNSLLKMVSLLSLFAAQAVLATAQMDRPLIITTIKPLAIIAQSAVGDQARVEYLQSAVQSAHALSLPVSALKKIDQADLIIWIGEIFESRVAKPMASVPSDKLITTIELPMTAPNDVVNPQVAGNLQEADDSGDHSHLSHNHNHLSEDPHIWLNPQNANLIAAEIQRRLNLPLKEIISAEQIANLTAELAPLRDKQFLVHHDALGHFTSTFKLQPGFSIRDASGASQGVRSQYRLRQEAKAAAASCVFVEPQYADRDAKIIADELSLPVALIDIQGLYQALNGNAYASFMQTLASQVKSCFDR